MVTPWLLILRSCRRDRKPVVIKLLSFSPTVSGSLFLYLYFCASLRSTNKNTKNKPPSSSTANPCLRHRLACLSNPDSRPPMGAGSRRVPRRSPAPTSIGFQGVDSYISLRSPHPYHPPLRQLPVHRHIPQGINGVIEFVNRLIRWVSHGILFPFVVL